MNYAIYSTTPGRILRTVSCGSNSPSSQLQEDESFLAVAASVTDSGFYINASGQLTAYPSIPSPFHVFNFSTGAYYDPRTAQDFTDATNALRFDSLAQIDTAAGFARLKYITSVPGQAETYQVKESQARTWQAASFAGSAPSFIAAEATALGINAQTLAVQIIDTADDWIEGKGPEIEACRRKWKVAIEAAGTDDADIITARDAGLTELAAL